VTQQSDPRDPYFVRHRKNALEWVMWAAVIPLVTAARLIDRLRGWRR